MIILGIDPDRGWAIARHGKNRVVRGRMEKGNVVLDAGSENGVDALCCRIRTLSKKYKIEKVRIEKPPNKKTYDRPGQSIAAMKKIAVDVGMNRAKADAVYYFCCGLGLHAEFVGPVKNGTKLNAKQIERLTGWTGRTNEHARDAIVLAWV